MANGKPRYCIGNPVLATGRFVSRLFRSILLQLMAATLVFCRLVLRPMTSPKQMRSFLVLSISSLVGIYGGVESYHSTTEFAEESFIGGKGL